MAAVSSFSLTFLIFWNALNFIGHPFLIFFINFEMLGKLDIIKLFNLKLKY